MSKSVTAFFQLPLFAVVGASTDRTKFGNKVLRAYQEHAMNVLPVSQKQQIIEGLPCVDSLTSLSQNLMFESKFPQVAGVATANQIGVSIITPPQATRKILEEGALLGYTNFFLQPGTCDAEVEKFIAELKKNDKKLNIIQGCVLVELNVEHD